MSITYLNHFLVENVSLTTFPVLFLILGFLEFFFFNMSLTKISKFFSRSHSSLQYQLISLLDDSKAQVEKESRDFDSSQAQLCFDEKIEEGSLIREEVEIVMGELGFFCDTKSEKLQEKLSSEDVFKIFEEREPSLDEVKSAFDVFDENRDGFIDARELQRVLSALGLKNESEMENCKRMIRVFDENEDERIDFNEFVKLMESSF